MSLPIDLGREAEAEFDEAVDWYEDRAGSGSEFIARFRETLQQISQFPELHAIVYGSDARRAVLRRYPYNVIYRVRANRVEVIAVFHASRDPAQWGPDLIPRGAGSIPPREGCEIGLSPSL